MGLACAPSLGQEACFRESDPRKLAYRLYQMAPPPASDTQPGYAHWPLTDAVSMNVRSIARSQSAKVGAYAFLWSNRCHALPGHPVVCGWNKKGNYLFPALNADGADIRPHFSTFERANTCTMAQAAHLLGAPRAEVAEMTKAARLTLVSRSADLVPMIKDRRLVDVCVLDDHVLPPSAKGIVLDYEVQDGRTPEMTLKFLLSFATLVHRHKKQAILFTNPLDAPTQKYTSINETNAPALLKAFDKVILFLWNNNKQKDIGKSFEAQLAILRGPGGKEQVTTEKLMLLFELNNTTLGEAMVVRRLAIENRINDVMLWRNLAKVGGDCSLPVNRKIACVAFGECGAGPVGTR